MMHTLSSFFSWKRLHRSGGFRISFFLLPLLILLLGGGSVNGQTVTVGSGTSAQIYPFGNFYGYERSASIYKASEIGLTGNITSLAWNATTPTNLNRPIVVYLAQVPDSTLTTTAWSTIIANATQVYSGNITPVSGWNMINLSTPFAFNGGANNLLVLVEANAGGSGITGSGGEGVQYSIAANMHEYWHQDQSAPTGNGTVTSNRPNLQLSMIPFVACSGTPTSGTISGPLGTLCQNMGFTLALSGQTLAAGVNFQWQSKPVSSATWTSIIGATSVFLPVLSGLTQGTDYRAIVSCSNSGLSDTSNVFTVNVADLFPAGTYTINPSLPASSTNFQTIGDAVNAMSCGVGVGNIIFNLAPNHNFNEQVTIPSGINTSSSSTVTFNGAGDTLTYEGSSSAPWTLGLDGADYVTFNNLIIQGTNSSYALAGHLWDGADSNRFNNCQFLTSLNSTSSTVIPFSISGSPTSGSVSGTSGQGNILDSCTFNGGYYCVTLYGNSSAAALGNKVRNSVLSDFYFYGLYSLYQSGVEITENSISRPTRQTVSTFYGIYLSTGNTNSLIEGNRISNPFGGAPGSSSIAYNIYVSSTSATAGNEIKIFNNLIGNMNGGNSSYGIYLPSASNVLVYNNTVSIDNLNASTGTVYGIYSTGASNVDVKNNVVSITQGGNGTKYCLYFIGSSKTSNNNDLFMGSTMGTNGIGYYSGSFSTLSSWQSANGSVWDQASISENPMFMSPSTGDFTPTNPVVDNLGIPVVGVSTDILGNPRSTTTPDIGAYEFSIPPCSGLPSAGNAQASVNVTCVNQPVVLNVLGSTIATGLTYQWEKGTSATGTFTPILGATTPVYSFTTTAPGVTYYKVAITCNGQTAYSDPDSVVVPDPFPTGIYTIDPSLPISATNFQSISDIISAMSCGIGGNITVNLAPGHTFNEQVTLPSSLQTSAAKSITFNGNGDTLTFSGSASLPWTLGFNGAGHIQVNNMVIVATDPTYALATHLWNGADSNNFNHCTFLTPVNATSTYSSPFSVSGSATSATTTGGPSGSWNVLDSCSMIGGYYSAAFCGDVTNNGLNNKVLNSLLEDFYLYGSYDYYQNGLEVKGNKISRPNRTTLSTFYGVYLSTGNSNSTIEGNQLGHQFDGDPFNTGTVYNIYVSSSSATPGNEIRILNNVIGNISGNGTVYGAYLPGAVNVQVYNNSISIDNQNATSGSAYGIYSTGTSNVDVKNNIVNINTGSGAVKYGLYFSGAGKTSNNNDIYMGSTLGTNNIGYYSSAFLTLSAWQGANGGIWDQNSDTLNPQFLNPLIWNFTPTNPFLDNKGTPLSQVTTDILGAARNPNTPDVGAYEFTVPTCSGLPSGGTIFANISQAYSGQNFIVSAGSNTSYGIGISYQWQSSPAGQNNWNDIANAAGSSINPTMQGATDYRLVVNCSSSNLSDTSNVVTVLLEQPDYIPVSLSGFNADVVANGIGAASNSTNNDVDGVSYALVSGDFQASANDPYPTKFLPSNGIIQNNEKLFVLADYNQNNSLRRTSNQTGTLTFVTPKKAKKVYVLGVSGSGASLVNATLYFNDGTNQVVSGLSWPDWFSTTGDIVASQVGRVLISTSALEAGTGPQLVENEISVSGNNQLKQIDSISFSVQSGSNVMNVLAISIIPPDSVSCSSPLLLTVGSVLSQSAQVNWHSNGSGSNYQLRYTDQGSLSSTGTLITVNGDTTYHLTGLTPSTTYDVFVRKVCGVGDTSDWVGPVLFQTTSNDCTGTPIVGQIDSSNFSICPNTPFSLSDTGVSAAGGVSYQWQKKEFNASWQNISGANDSTLSMVNGITVETQFRFYATCSFSGLSDTSNPITVSINPGILCYCQVTSTSVNYGISNFTTTNGVTNINNTTSGGAYSNYSSTLAVSQYPGDSVNFSISSATGTAGMGIWVDWNDNGSFNDAGEHVYNSAAYNAIGTGSITVPANTPSGSHRMRVVANYNANNPTACGDLGNLAFGEAEDYTFEVIPFIQCNTVNLPANIASTISQDTVCLDGDVILGLDTVFTGVTGLTYQWQKSANGTSGWMNIGMPQLIQDLTDTSVNSNTWYRCQILCDGTLDVMSSVISVFVVDPALTNVSTDQSLCGPGTVSLNASAGTGVTINWYNAQSGGNLLQSGNSYMPVVAQTDTFWVAGITTSCESPRQPVIVDVQDPIVLNLGNDTAICEGTSLTLNAGTPGSTYQWNTGDTTQTISVTTSGDYDVQVTAPWGCTGVDSIHIDVTPLPHVDDITAFRNGDDSYTFTANGVVGATNYNWDFGDGQGMSNTANPTYLYDSYGDYTVTLVVSNNCGSDTVHQIVHYMGEGIGNVDPGKNILKLYPNPAKDIVSLKNESNQKMQSVVVYNILGQQIFRGNTSNGQTYQLHIDGYASGMYSVKIFFEDGSWAQRKFEIAK